MSSSGCHEKLKLHCDGVLQVIPSHCAAMESFRAYDFGSDPRWQQYRAGIEVPPGMDEGKVLQKYKAKWYQREVDSTFDVASASGMSSARQTPQSAAADDPSAQPQNPPADPTASAAGTSASAHSTPDPFQAYNAVPPAARGWQAQLSWLSERIFKQGPEQAHLILFILHIMLISLALLTLQPIKPRLARLAWTYFLQTSIICSGCKVYLTSGFPHLRPFIPNIKNWLMRVGPTTDFQYMFYSIIFLVQEPMKLVLVPITVLAVYHAFAYCAKNFSRNKLWKRYGVKVHSFLAAHQRDALFYNASAEIGVGFYLVLMILTPKRAIMNTFAYWHWLRMRYASPDSAAQHSMVWSALDGKFGVYARQPILRVPLGFAQRWFLSASRQ